MQAWPQPLWSHVIDRASAVRESRLSLPCQGSRRHHVNLTVPDIEVGYELYQYVPRVFALCMKGRLASLSICTGRHPFYYFVPRWLLTERTDCTAKFGHERNQGSAAQHSAPPMDAVYPPYAEVFALPPAARVPYVYLFNKRSSEWGGPPVNTWSADEVRRLCERLIVSSCYRHLFYFRSRNSPLLGPLMGTGSKQWGDDDVEAARSCRGGFVVSDWLQAEASHRADRRGAVQNTADAISEPSSELELANTAQLVLMANAAVSIGVQGGMAVLNGLVGGRAVVLCRRGIECENDYGWYPKIANSTMASMRSAADAIALVTWLCGRTPIAITGREMLPVGLEMARRRLYPPTLPGFHPAVHARAGTRPSALKRPPALKRPSAVNRPSAGRGVAASDRNVAHGSAQAASPSAMTTRLRETPARLKAPTHRRESAQANSESPHVGAAGSGQRTGTRAEASHSIRSAPGREETVLGALPQKARAGPYSRTAATHSHAPLPWPAQLTRTRGMARGGGGAVADRWDQVERWERTDAARAVGDRHQHLRDLKQGI